MDNFNKNLIIVDGTDKIIGSKKALVSHHLKTLTLHRAFSVFLFSSDNKMLVQKRSLDKFVFPEHWGNTCCSHPFLSEMSFKDPLSDVKIHAIKRLQYELGIKENEVGFDDLLFKERIVYIARPEKSEGKFIGTDIKSQETEIFPESQNIMKEGLKSEDFGEYEVDYILFVKKNSSDLTIKPNPSEVMEARWVSKQEFDILFKNEKIVPWVRVLCQYIDPFSYFK
ncbi:isopentenyl-diphosphate delta-isomerase [Hamiltosporidium magnivora]|uniref:isopentenyl-diphosphate Delta-isomerase n=1 Tax=Hamiltosporidium magnivora TaxID=148818 RepID=A0A4Q9KW01_9MICR|nr:isopentenyl-diphosphate delta-isomerase [Hamiltosporidium magnivora]